MRILYLIRGVSGSGKSTFAATLGCPVYSADDFFMVDGEYKFDPNKLTAAHRECQIKVDTAMCCEETIAVANTFTQAWEMKAYFDLAELHGYTVFSIIVENRHGGKNEHGVPDVGVQRQKDRFEVSL